MLLWQFQNVHVGFLFSRTTPQQSKSSVIIACGSMNYFKNASWLRIEQHHFQDQNPAALCACAFKVINLEKEMINCIALAADTFACWGNFWRMKSDARWFFIYASRLCKSFGRGYANIETRKLLSTRIALNMARDFGLLTFWDRSFYSFARLRVFHLRRSFASSHARIVLWRIAKITTTNASEKIARLQKWRKHFKAVYEFRPSKHHLFAWSLKIAWSSMNN